jgi:site-specific recombinase XerD
LRYLQARKILTLDLSEQVLAPAKTERVPKTFDYIDLLNKIKEFPEVDNITKRNRALLWTLLETGCQVHEIRGLKFDLLVRTPDGKFQIEIPGKSERSIEISVDLFNLLEGLKSQSKDVWIFMGFNRFGSLSGPISPRGVELMVKTLSKHWKLNELTPRTFRHTSILYWFKNKVPAADIQKRLGLKSQYTFKHYLPLL